MALNQLRCSHCLPDCESTIYTSSVSATPLRRSSCDHDDYGDYDDNDGYDGVVGYDVDDVVDDNDKYQV